MKHPVSLVCRCGHAFVKHAQHPNSPKIGPHAGRCKTKKCKCRYAS